MFTFKNVLIVLLIITIIWIIYLFAKTLKTSATSGSFQKKLADRKKKLDNQKTREEKAQEKAELKAAIAAKRAEWKAQDDEKAAIVKAELEELLAEKEVLEPEWKRICKEYKANPNDEEVASLVYFPLFSPSGKEVNLLVKEKSKVKVGTKIMERVDFEVPIFSSVSGVVKGIEKRYSALVGKPVDHLVIKNDYKYSLEKLPIIDYKSASKEELVEAIKNAGMVGLGGAGFPTYVKYSSNAKIESLLINAVECEPYLTTDYVSIIEETKMFLEGVSILKKASGANEAIIAFKNNKKELQEVLK